MTVSSQETVTGTPNSSLRMENRQNGGVAATLTLGDSREITWGFKSAEEARERLVTADLVAIDAGIGCKTTGTQIETIDGRSLILAAPYTRVDAGTLSDEQKNAATLLLIDDETPESEKRMTFYKREPGFAQE